MSDPKKAADIISIENSSDKSFEDEWKIEVNEWVESLEAVKDSYGQKQVKELLRSLQNFALSQGITQTEATLNTPYRNSIPLSDIVFIDDSLSLLMFDDLSEVQRFLCDQEEGIPLAFFRHLWGKCRIL